MGALYNIEDPAFQVKFKELAAITKELTGIKIQLSTKDVQLVSTRLGKLSKKYGEVDVEGALLRIRKNDRAFVQDYIQCITTNTTHFFRENSHFEYLKTYIPDYLKKQSSHEYRVWCAVSSTGEEPYTIAMTVNEILASSNLGFKMLASDIDENVIRTAIAGQYSKDSVEKVPKPYVSKYFDSIAEGDQTFFRKSKNMPDIKFATMNLLKHPFPFHHKFDLIFCRNVFIYFEKETIYRIVEQMCKHLMPGGLLILGHSESLLEIPKYIERLGPSIYRKVS